tara:strand:- start:60 stop:869 length:810 start_codon:yes stop_codon:yes gene_type:complete
MKTPLNNFKKSLKAGKQQYGFWLGLCSPLSAEICGLCGYDWLLIDGEHAPNDLHSIKSQLLAIDNTPTHPVVRIVEGQTALIKQVLDIGAQTILVPMVESAQQAERLVSAMHYPPRGNRGVGTALARAARWNRIENYFTEVDEQLCLLIQVESVTALENLDDILKVEGIDGVFIGPADLAASMGHLGNPSHPEVIDAVTDAIGKIKKSGRAAGTLATTKTMASTYEAAGAQFIALGVDTLALADAASTMLKNFLSDEKGNNSEPGNGAY